MPHTYRQRAYPQCMGLAARLLLDTGIDTQERSGTYCTAGLGVEECLPQGAGLEPRVATGGFYECTPITEAKAEDLCRRRPQPHPCPRLHGFTLSDVRCCPGSLAPWAAWWTSQLATRRGSSVDRRTIRRPRAERLRLRRGCWPPPISFGRTASGRVRLPHAQDAYQSVTEGRSNVFAICSRR